MFNGLSPEQLQAATLLDTPLSIIASAGSGKTSTLVERYFNLLRTGLLPREIVTVTFTKEATQELKERILERAIEGGISNSILEQLESSHRIGTIHSLCYSIINQYGSEVGLPPIQSILEESQFLAAFLKLYRDWLEQLPEKMLGQLLDHFNHRELEDISRLIFRQKYLFFDCVSLAQSAQARDRGAAVITLLAEALQPLFSAVEDLFHKQGAFSFDDLEHFTLRILRDSALARTRLRNDFRHILIDEFQDTSAIQWQILSTLVGENFEKVCIVGDPKQSIYGFRNAEPRLFHEVSSHLCARQGVPLELTRNFRTGANLLSSLNTLSESLFQDQAFAWSPMIAGITQDPSLSRDGFHIERIGSTEKTTRSELQNEELQRVVAEVERLISVGEEPGSIALLFRNSDRIADFREALSQKGIPTDCKRTLSLSTSLDAMDLVSFLQFVADPLNDAALVHFLRSSYVNWSYEQVLQFTSQRTKGESALEPLVLVLLRTNPQSLGWLLELLLAGETRTSKFLEALFLNSRDFPRTPEALDALLKMFSDNDSEIFQIQNFLEAFPSSDILFQEDRPLTDMNNGIKLMTVHSSKGLEFDHVFLVDTLRQLPQDSPPLLLKAGLPPGIKFWENDSKTLSGSYESLLEERRINEANEARRILYVAITRARKSLKVFLPMPGSIKLPKNSWAELLEKGLEGFSASLGTGGIESPVLSEVPIGVGTTD